MITLSPPSLRPDSEPSCPLCAGITGRVVWHCSTWRVIHADSAAEKNFPAFYRLICNAHYEEWTDLPQPMRQEGIAILDCIETMMRQYLKPHKVNLASLGNVVPHLHWHIIGRFDWDSHFPAPVWAGQKRNADTTKITAIRDCLPNFESALIKALLPWKDKD